MNKQIDSQVIVDIIKRYTTLAKPINQHKIAEEYMWRTNEHITSRTVRKVIESLIEQGEPIISTPGNNKDNPGGYCYGGNTGEALECYKRLRRKAIKEMLRARWTLRNCRNRRGQLRLI